MDKDTQGIIKPPIINPSTQMSRINEGNIHLVAEYFITRTDLAEKLYEELRWQLGKHKTKG